MTTSKERIGFVGLGNMGRPMASNLVRKGFPLIVLDTVQERMDALIAQGHGKDDWTVLGKDALT